MALKDLVIDQRVNKWLGSKRVNGQAYNYPYKYKVKDYNPVTEHRFPAG